MSADQHPSDDPIPRDRFDALVGQVEALTEQLAAVTARLDERAVAAPAPVPAPVLPDPVRAAALGADDEATARSGVGRRRALVGLAGALAVGAAAATGSAHPVAAANGDHLVIGVTTNIGTAATGLAVTGTSAGYGLGAVDNGLATLSRRPAILGHGKNQNFSDGVYGLGEANATGVRGQALGTGSGVVGSATTGQAGLFSSGTPTGIGVYVIAQNHVYLNPATTVDPPSGAADGFPGLLRWNTPNPGSNALWACVGAGTPGTWRKIAGTGTAGAFHLLPTPLRAYDSRPGTNPPTGPKSPLPGGYAARTLDLGQLSTPVPFGATGALITVLLVNAASGSGNISIWANDKPKPASNTMVWGGSAGRFTTLAVTALDAARRVKVDSSLRTDIVIDVVGFYQ